MTEIEKKFQLFRRPPQEVLGTGTLIRQGYLFTENGEVRLRQKLSSHYLTVKGEGGLAREEWEVEIPKWVFEILWPRTGSRVIEKTRYRIEHSGHSLEFDEYHGRLDGLLTMECEFQDETAADQFSLPLWAETAEDVTLDKSFKNKALAVHGRPTSARIGSKLDR